MSDDDDRTNASQLATSVLRAVPMGIGVIVDRIIREVNESLCQMTGYSRDELIGQPARMMYETEEVYRAAADVYRQLTVRPTATYEARWRRKDGQVLDIVLHAAHLDARDPSRGTTFSVADVTEARRASEALRASQALLSESQRVTHIGSWELDLASGRLTWTDECFRIYGHEPNEFQPNLDRFVEAVVPEDRATVTAHYKTMLATGQFPPFEVRITRTDGDLRWLHVTGAIATDASGTPVRCLGTQQDITDRRRAEEERLELERRLLYAQKLESLGRMAGGIAHDFNNLLMAVLGNLELACAELPPESPARLTIQQARIAAERATDLTRQMLAYSGRSSFQITGVHLSRLVEEHAHLFRACVTRQVALVMSLEPNVPLIEADAGQVQQVIMNLVTNAVEAIGDRAGTVTLSTGVRDCDEGYLGRSQASLVAPGRFVYVEVSDTGCGMDEGVQRRLFDPFFTTKFVGRGLGMPAILGIVTGHKAAILVESAPARGTTIRVLLPAVGGRAAADARDEAAAGGAVSRPDGEKGTVLVIDDEDLVRNACARMLRRRGWQVIDAASGAEGIEVFRRHAAGIVCVILDLSMPGMDGLAVFKALKWLDPNVKVILSSGYNSDLEALQALPGQGLAGFIQKPYTSDRLCEEVTRATGGTDAR